MKEFFKDIRGDKTARFGFLGACILSHLTFFYVLLTYRNLSPFIPIFNQLPWGEQRLGITLTIFIPILIDWLIIILNLFISVLLYQKMPLVSRMLAITTFVVTTLTFLFVVKTVVLVT